MYGFVFNAHLRLALHAMLLFAVGLFAAWPAVHYRLRALGAPPMAVFRFVLRLMGPSPTVLRMSAVIFCFNGAAIFVYMASGFHPIVPRLFALWTGANIVLVLGMARQEENLLRMGEPKPGQWMPPPGLVSACSAVVLLLELPCFWFSLAMGMSMGNEVQAGVSTYGAALGQRAHAYLVVVVPLLLVSACAEAIAIRGSAARTA